MPRSSEIVVLKSLPFHLFLKKYDKKDTEQGSRKITGNQKQHDNKGKKTKKKRSSPKENACKMHEKCQESLVAEG